MPSIGAMIMSVFAAIWWILGIQATGHRSWLLILFPLLVTGAIILVAARGPRSAPSPGNSRIGRVVGIASGIEGLLIFLAANVLMNTGKGSFLVPAIAIIVGLHFLPLARWIPVRSYYLIGLLMVALGLLGIALPDLNTRILWVSTGSAAILWWASIGSLFRMHRAQASTDIPE
jgi:hypothetical protein